MGGNTTAQLAPAPLQSRLVLPSSSRISWAEEASQSSLNISSAAFPPRREGGSCRGIPQGNRRGSGGAAEGRRGLPQTHGEQRRARPGSRAAAPPAGRGSPLAPAAARSARRGTPGQRDEAGPRRPGAPRLPFPWQRRGGAAFPWQRGARSAVTG